MAPAPAEVRGVELERQLAQVPITSVAFYYTPCGKRHYLAGQDGHLAVYKDAHQPCDQPLFFLPIFEDQPIHGIRVQRSRILLFGAARIALLDGHGLAEGSSPAVLSRAYAPDWIYDAALSPVDTDQIVLVTAHNEVVRMRYGSSGGSSADILLECVISPSRPMLYAAKLSWVADSQVVVAAGTVFGDVLVWTCNLLGNEHTPQFVLRGHEGSIYGVDISPLLVLSDGSRTRLLASCSDDRTLRIWDISGDAVHAGVPSGDLETGFKAAESYGELHAVVSAEGEATPVAVAMGHASRIWGVQFGISSAGRECALEGSSLAVYSYGEDATVQRWELDFAKGASPGPLRGDLVHQRTYSLHSGKHLWARALDFRPGGVSILTGGADGRIGVIEESAATDDDIMGTSLATVDVHDLLACLPEIATTGSPREIVSRYDFTSSDSILVITNFGRLFTGHLPTKQWKQVVVQEKVAEDLKKCYALRKIGRSAAVIGTTHGKIFQVLSNGNDVVLAAEVPGRVTDMNHLSTDAQSTRLLVHIHGSSSSHLLVLDPSGALIERQLVSGLDARFVAVSATLVDDLLILGSRHGWLSLLTLEEHGWQPILDVAPRSRDAITCIVPLPASKQEITSSSSSSSPTSTTPSYILATSRDGKYRIYSIDRVSSSPHIKLLHETAPPFGPMIEGAWFTEGPCPELFLYGFRSKDFVIWNESKREELVAVGCGGAHRTFRLDFSICKPEKYRFAYTRTSRLCIFSQEGVPYRTVRRGTHGREIRALSCNGRLVASGAEDTSIRIWEYTGGVCGAEMRHLACMKAHVTGLQKLHWFEDDYLFSSAGNEEFFVWRLRRLDSLYKGLAVVCEGVFSDERLVGDLRIMDFDVTRRERGDMTVSLAFSNSTLRTYEYDGRGGFRLLSQGTYTGACLTQLRHLDLGASELCVMTASTDGYVVLWRTSLDGDAVQEHLLTAAAAVHQSSIKSLDLVRDGSKYHVMTGGDDNAVGLVSVNTAADGGCGFVTQGIVRRAHAAAVNGVALLAPHSNSKLRVMLAASVSNDQRVKIWRISISTGSSIPHRVTLAACASSGVADPGDVAVVCAEPGQPNQFVLGGVGLEAWRVDLMDIKT